MRPERLLDEAERRWRVLLGDRPELGTAVELQRHLIARSLRLGFEIDARPPLRVGLDPEMTTAKLRQRCPVLSGEPFELDVTGLEPYVVGFCSDLAQGAAEAPASRLQETLERGQIDLGSLLAASLARRQHAIRTKASHLGIAPDLLWLVAELSVGPVAHRLQRSLLADAADSNTALASALEEWHQGCCPACGSWPAFAEEHHGERHLRCSFCGSSWQLAPYQCIYCGESGESFLTAATDLAVAVHRLELCRSCGGYLKSIAVEHSTPFELLPVEDLRTTDLDAGAAGRGYARPSMREIGTV